MSHLLKVTREAIKQDATQIQNVEISQNMSPGDTTDSIRLQDMTMQRAVKQVGKIGKIVK